MKKLLSITLVAVLFFLAAATSHASDPINCWFPPAWKSKRQQAADITAALSEGSGIKIVPRIGNSYPEILAAFKSDGANLVYVGSFVQAIIHSRELGNQLVQAINGKEFYSGVMVYPAGHDPKAILQSTPELIAFAKGASSGESSAKAATDGKASIATPNHKSTCMAVMAGKAKGGFVKNYWWDANKEKFNKLAMYEVEGVSLRENPDNILTASKSIPAEDLEKITQAAISSAHVFGADTMIKFSPDSLQFSLELLKRGNIAPLTYTW